MQPIHPKGGRGMARTIRIAQAFGMMMRMDMCMCTCPALSCVCSRARAGLAHLPETGAAHAAPLFFGKKGWSLMRRMLPIRATDRM